MTYTSADYAAPFCEILSISASDVIAASGDLIRDLDSEQDDFLL